MIFVQIRTLLARVIHNPPPRVRIAALLLSVLCYGATGYVYFEVDKKPDLTLLDGFWWALVTMATVGYGDYFPTTPGGRFLVAAPMMLVGVGMLGYTLSLASAALIEAKSREIKGEIAVKMKDHLVVINLPSVEKICRLLDDLLHEDALGAGAEVVLIDEELEQLPPELLERRVRFVRGNPARDEVLARASVGAARQAIVLARRPGDPHSDNQVLAVTLAIESSFPGVHTVVECVDASTEGLLRKAGCDRVVCIARFDTAFVSGEALNPGSQEVVAELLSNEGQQLFITALGGARFADVAAAAAACQAQGHLLIGVRRGTATSLNPPANTPIQAGDQLLTIGATKPRLG